MKFGVSDTSDTAFVLPRYARARMRARDGTNRAPCQMCQDARESRQNIAGGYGVKFSGMASAVTPHPHIHRFFFFEAQFFVVLCMTRKVARWLAKNAALVTSGWQSRRRTRKRLRTKSQPTDVCNGAAMCLELCALSDYRIVFPEREMHS